MITAIRTVFAINSVNYIIDKDKKDEKKKDLNNNQMYYRIRSKMKY